MSTMDELFDGGNAQEPDQSAYLLEGERPHIPSAGCWCKPYQDDQCPDVWIHNELPIGRA